MLKQGSWTSGDEAAQAGFDLRLFYKVLPDLIFEPPLDVCYTACQALLHQAVFALFWMHASYGAPHTSILLANSAWQALWYQNFRYRFCLS